MALWACLAHPGLYCFSFLDGWDGLPSSDQPQRKVWEVLAAAESCSTSTGPVGHRLRTSGTALCCFCLLGPGVRTRIVRGFHWDCAVGWSHFIYPHEAEHEQDVGPSYHLSCPAVTYFHQGGSPS